MCHGLLDDVEIKFTAGSGSWTLKASDAKFLNQEGTVNLGRLPFDNTFGPLKLESLWAPCALRGIDGEQTAGAVTVNGSLHLTHTSPAPIPGLLAGMVDELWKACRS
jgi:hypothetical protein